MAGALGDQPQGVAHQALEGVEARARDSDAAGMAVVDEHGRSAGLVVEGGRHMIVTAGLGTSGVPLRVGVPPEFTIIDVTGP